MSRVLCIAALLSTTTAGAAESPKPRTAISASLVLKVSDREKTADSIIETAEESGGYFANRSDDAVTLKVPVEEAKPILATIESLGVVVEKRFQAHDMGARLAELRTLLASREKVFQRYFAVLNNAGLSSVVQVEAQMTSLVEEIEGLRGAIRLIEHQLQYAEVQVHFQFRDRRPPSRDGNSSFAWLNTVNLADLFEEFARVH